MARAERSGDAPPLIRCSACGATNRVAREKLAAGLAPVCGRCGAPLSASGDPLTVTDATFATDVERSPLPVLLDAWAPWCGPCQMISPVVMELAREMAGRLRVGKLNVDENPGSAMRYNIRGIPTILLFKGGQVVEQRVGATGKADLEKMLSSHL